MNKAHLIICAILSAAVITSCAPNKAPKDNGPTPSLANIAPGAAVTSDAADTAVSPDTEAETPGEDTMTEDTITIVSGSPDATIKPKPYEPPTLDKLPEDIGYREGRFFRAKSGTPMIFIDNYGPCTMSRAEASVSFDSLTDGDLIKVGFQLVMETYPGQMPVFTVEKLSDGEFADLDISTLASLTGMGYVEMAKIIGDVQYIRTDGYNEIFEYPYLVKITSRAELDEYTEAFSGIYSLGSRSTVYSDTSIGFADAITKYDEVYFEKNVLYMAVLEEGSGSIRHELTDIEGGFLKIESTSPEVFTDDMAEWHILVEVPVGVELWGVNQNERVYTADEVIEMIPYNYQ